MATRSKPKEHLSAPSEFSKKESAVKKQSQSVCKITGKPTEISTTLLPPSKYVKSSPEKGVKIRRPQMSSAKVKEKKSACSSMPSDNDHNESNDKTKVITAPSAQQPKQKVSQNNERPDKIFLMREKPKLDQELLSSTFLVNEIQSCKEQNKQLHQSLTRQLHSLSIAKSKDSKNSRPEMEKLNELLLQVQENQEQNSKFHELLQQRVHSQAGTVENITEQFLERQSDLRSENEILSQKLHRMTEENIDVKMYLEKRLETKEKECYNNFVQLEKLRNVLGETTALWENDKVKFFDEKKERDYEISLLKSQVNTMKMEKNEMGILKEKELNEAKAAYNDEISSLESVINNLRNELKLEKSRNSEIVNSWKEKEKLLCDKSKQNKDELEGINLRLCVKEEELKKIKMEADVTNTKSHQKVKDLQSKIEKNSQFYEDQIKKSREEFKIMLNNEKHTSKVIEEKLTEKSHELETAKAELKKLHAFIADKEIEMKSQQFEIKLRDLEEENSKLLETCKSLESAVELLNVRLLSMNNVIRIQETEISRGGILQNGEQSSNLLTKWRDKVYMLLVQLKSYQIMENEDMIKLKQKLESYHYRVQDYSTKISLLENQFQEKRAEIGLKDNEMVNVKRELQGVKEKLNNTEEQNQKHETFLETVVLSLEKFSSMYLLEMKKIEDGVMSCKALESRVNFANKRIKVIGELFNRRDAVWKAKLVNVVRKQNEQSVGKVDEFGSIHDERSLLKEVENLTNEREFLMNKIKSDAETISTIQNELETQYKGKLLTREQKIEELECKLETNLEEYASVKQNMESYEEENKHLKEEVEALRFDIRRVESQFENDLRLKLETEKASHQDELEKMDKVINETRQEHTKAIASLRQIERQLAWQKQNSEHLIKENDEIYKLEIEKLERKAYDLEKERNILLTTIKQENIRMPRVKHEELDAFIGEEEVRTRPIRAKKTKQKKITQEGIKVKSKQKSSDMDQEKLAVMLKELQSISASLLEEDNTTTCKDASEEMNLGNNTSTSGEM